MRILLPDILIKISPSAIFLFMLYNEIMAITPQTDIYLLKCPIEADNRNQINFANATAQYNYFNSLPKEKKYIYTLDVFTQDGSAEVFFGENGEILTSIICDALRTIGMNSFADELFDIAKMYNKDDESVSFDKDRIENFDKTLNERDVLTQIKVNSAKYIRENLNLL